MLNNDSCNKFTDNQIDNTSQDTFVYKTDESNQQVYRYYKNTISLYIYIYMESLTHNADDLLVYSV